VPGSLDKKGRRRTFGFFLVKDGTFFPLFLFNDPLDMAMLYSHPSAQKEKN
jgi:hypothetical protein